MGMGRKKERICLFVSFLVFLFFTEQILAWETDLDYHYEYEKSGVYTKFSDWVPYRLHKWEPKYLEDFYEMSNWKQHYGEKDLLRNIYFLKIALGKRFRHPKQALCEIKSENEYYKYRNLVSMHIHLRILRSYLRIGSLYDKRHVYFQNLDFAQELKQSFSVAESYYSEAIPHWKKAEEHAKIANEIPIDLDLGTMETEAYEIRTGKLDMGLAIERHLDRLSGKKQIVLEFLAKHPEADKPNLDQIKD